MINPEHNSTISIVDADSEMQASLKWLLESVGLRAAVYGCAQEFLDSNEAEQSACVLLDAWLPDMHGLQLHRTLLHRGINAPVIFMTRHGDVRMAVTALKQGAFDFIEKPHNDQLLLDCVQQALEQEQFRRIHSIHDQQIRQRFATLTRREQEVMERIAQGMANQAIAETMRISRKTVEVHRARVMEKMHARTFSDLIQMAIILGLLDEYIHDENNSALDE